MAAGAPSPVEQSERSLTAARAQEMLLLEEEKRRLEASRLRCAAAVPLPPDAESLGGVSFSFTLYTACPGTQDLR